MLSHDEIERLIFLEDVENKRVIAVNRTYPPYYEVVVFDEKALADDRFAYLLQAAPYMYQVLSKHFSILQNFVRTINESPKTKEKEDLKAVFMAMMKGCEIAQSVAQNGIRAVSKNLELSGLSELDKTKVVLN